MKSPPSIRLSGWFTCGSIKLPYDFLILATGIQYNYFGHDDWRRVAPGLESLDDADLIRGKVLTAFERAEETAALDHRDHPEIRQLLTFVLVGAGTVGVEMASTLAEMSRMALTHDFRISIRVRRAFCCTKRRRAYFPPFPKRLSAKAQRHLESLGVEMYTNTRVTSVDEGGIVADGKRVPASTVLWGAGVLASPAGRWLGAAMDRSGKIIVNADLSVPGHPEIFAIGDTAHVVAESRNLLGIKSKQPMTMPGVAQPAIQEGQYVARLIRRRVAGKPAPPPFWYWDKGDLAIVGRTYALADLRFVRFAGFLAWVLWAVVHIYFLIGFANRFFVVLEWGVAFVTKRRQVRVFPGQERAERRRRRKQAPHAFANADVCKRCLAANSLWEQRSYVRLSLTGRITRTVVPLPGVLVISKVPFNCATRSRIPAMPTPKRTALGPSRDMIGNPHPSS